MHDMQLFISSLHQSIHLVLLDQRACMKVDLSLHELNSTKACYVAEHVTEKRGISANAWQFSNMPTTETSCMLSHREPIFCMFVSISNSLDRPLSKRCTGLSTCVLGRLSQDIHKLQTYPRTDVGAGTPGKKRSLFEQFENYSKSNIGNYHF